MSKLKGTCIQSFATKNWKRLAAENLRKNSKKATGLFALDFSELKVDLGFDSLINYYMYLI